MHLRRTAHMKMVTAVIQPSRLEVVKDLLSKKGVKGLTVTDVHGVGRQHGRTEIYRGHEYTVNLVSKVKLEIAVEDGDVPTVIETIVEGARTAGEGKIGDGKIFVLPLEEVVRIRTGEVDAAAL
jgi:nitrogen regulatory protein PII